jgi:mannose-6-phosphate isomerase-like protein (cupin superfamily)
MEVQMRSLLRFKAAAMTGIAGFALGFVAHGSAAPAAAPAAFAPPVPGFQITHVGAVLKGHLQQFAPGVRGADLGGTTYGDAGVIVLSKVGLHAHEKSDEFVYVLSGSGSLTAGSRSYAIAAGDFFVLPKTMPHALTATSGQFTLLGFSTPPQSKHDMIMIQK